MIISISRRCDIPRFRFNWFMERLDAGFVDVRNPFNAAQVRRVSLLPAGDRIAYNPAKPEEAPEVLVFWTRDPGAILVNTENLETRGFRFYVMVTLTGYPSVLEPNAPEQERVITSLISLSNKIGPRRLIWRYDPIFLSSITDADFHLRNFTALTEALTGKICRVIVSIYDPYRGAERRLAALEKSGALSLQSFRDADMQNEPAMLPVVRKLLADLAEIAAGAGMTMQSCTEDLAGLGIKAGACIDGELIRELWGIEAGGKDRNQRPHCRCVPSVDIGSYGSCQAGCVYCYACS